MAEKRETDEGQLIDQTLLLFQNAIAEAENVVPPAQIGCAVEAKDRPLSKPPEKTSGLFDRRFRRLCQDCRWF